MKTERHQLQLVEVMAAKFGKLNGSEYIPLKFKVMNPHLFQPQFVWHMVFVSIQPYVSERAAVHMASQYREFTRVFKVPKTVNSSAALIYWLDAHAVGVAVLAELHCEVYKEQGRWRIQEFIKQVGDRKKGMTGVSEE